YLANADLSYSPIHMNGRILTFALLYNLQGPRIHTVGINHLGNIKETARHTLDFNMNYTHNERLNFKLQAKNLLNPTIKFKQEITSTKERPHVETYKTNIALQIGATYSF